MTNTDVEVILTGGMMLYKIDRVLYEGTAEEELLFVDCTEYERFQTSVSVGCTVP